MSSSPLPDQSRLTGTTEADIENEVIGIDEIGQKHNEKLSRSALLYDFVKVWLEAGGAGIRVAVIDTGIDLEHPAFPKGAIGRAVRVVNDRIDEGPDAAQDEEGHGTHCAGIIAARPLKRIGGSWVAFEPPGGQVSEPAATGEPEHQSGWGGTRWHPVDHAGAPESPDGVLFDDLGVRFSGVAPLASLLVYKVTEGRSREARLDDVALAINTAVNDGADLISISIQGERGTNALFFAVHRALSKRRGVVTIAGNRGRLRQVNIGYPGRYGGVITVAAHDRFGNPSAFTSAGGEVDMSGPGEDVWSTGLGETYKSLSGTSMATPWVAGIAALILSKHRAAGSSNRTPIRNCEELREHLLRLASHPGFYNPPEGYGPLWPGNAFGRESV